MRGRYFSWQVWIQEELPEEQDGVSYHIAADEHAFIEEDCVIRLSRAQSSTSSSRGPATMRWAQRYKRQDTTGWKVSMQNPGAPTEDADEEKSGEAELSSELQLSEDEDMEKGDTDVTEDGDKKVEKKSRAGRSTSPQNRSRSSASLTLWEVSSVEDFRDGEGRHLPKRQRSRPPLPPSSSARSTPASSRASSPAYEEMKELRQMQRSQQQALDQMQAQLKQVSDLLSQSLQKGQEPDI